MLSLEKCKEILNSKEKKYSDQEVSRVRDILYRLAELELQSYLKKKNEERNNLHQGINGRAG